MLIKANVSFAGIVTMKKGEERELEASAALSDLLRCGYVSEVKGEVIPDEGKRDNPRKRKAESAD